MSRFKNLEILFAQYVLSGDKDINEVPKMIRENVRRIVEENMTKED